MTFAEFFKAVWGQDQNPFPWQERLAEMVLSGNWPPSIGLPTAAGKTALIDIAVFALAMRAPGAVRRTFFVVDRRIIVDEAAERANKLADRLLSAHPKSALGKIAATLREIGDGVNSKPLETAMLRGGILRDDSWAKSPRQPLVVCSTVDQVGSSLLFRAYGTNNYNWPIRAALVAHDSLLILDEAHISQPFAETAERIIEYQRWAATQIVSGLKVIEMSATPRSTEVFRETEKDYQDPILKGRWTASKRAILIEEGKPPEDKAEGKSDTEGLEILVKALVREAQAMRNKLGATVIGVIANRVGTARSVYEALNLETEADAILMIGRARAYDRDRIWEKWRESIRLGRTHQPSRPIYVVATQCIEVGANIDFDALVTEVASVDALEQRFGRLNRAGRDVISHAAIVAQKSQVGAKAQDKIYGEALAATWRWLKNHLTTEVRLIELPAEGKKKPKMKKEKVEYVEMGVLALRKALTETAEKETLIAERRNAPVLMPSHMDLLSQTSPEPAVSPDPSLFLHGPQTEPADVQVVWRADVNEENRVHWCQIVSICPPSAAEAVALPYWVVRKWLCTQPAMDLGDMEGAAAEDVRLSGRTRPAICWMGLDESRLIESWEDLRPGMTLVVPATYGGCDEWGWNPKHQEPVRNVGDPVKLALGRPILRLDPSLAESWNYSDLAAQLRTCDFGSENDVLRPVPADSNEWVNDAINAIVARRRRLVESPVNDEEWAAVSGLRAFEQESSRSAFTLEVPLDDHLAGCARWAEGFAADLPAQLWRTVVRAAQVHDIGKADPRFQAWLRGGNPIQCKHLLAKSKRSAMDSGAIERARRLAGYPKGARHELMSVALMMTDKATGDWDNELLLHLVASHHGRCRPFAPVIEDHEPVEVRYETAASSSNHRLEGLSSGISLRFWKLGKRYGWYGLAYLEMLVRLADHRRSEEEELQADA